MISEYPLKTKILTRTILRKMFKSYLLKNECFRTKYLITYFTKKGYGFYRQNKGYDSKLSTHSFQGVIMQAHKDEWIERISNTR